MNPERADQLGVPARRTSFESFRDKPEPELNYRVMGPRAKHAWLRSCDSGQRLLAGWHPSIPWPDDVRPYRLRYLGHFNNCECNHIFNKLLKSRARLSVRSG